MGRRTKEELLAANYYEWLAACNVLREKKKGGTKLTADEKMLLRTVPSPEKPFNPGLPAGQPAKKEKKKSAVKAKIDFDKTVIWPVRGGAFLCAVYNCPFEDVQCMLFCERDDCPFHGIGYMKAHGLK